MPARSRPHAPLSARSTALSTALGLALAPALGGCLSPLHGGTAGEEDSTGSTSAASASSGQTTAPTTDAPTSTGGPDTTGGDTTGEPPEPPGPPDMWCPGGPQGGCDDVPGAKLEAGASVLSIIPNCFEAWVDDDNDFTFKKGFDTLLDCGCDRLCPGDPGYSLADVGEGDGILQTTFMAGFGRDRPAQGVRGADKGLVGEGDGLWARAVTFRQGDVTLAIVALDVVGYFNNDVETIRGMLADEGVDVDYLIVHATHTHEGPDTMGLWGKTILESGYDPAYRQQIHQTVVDAVLGTFKDMREVGSMKVGEVDISTYHNNGVANLISDHRDPWVIDEMISAAHFIDTEGATIATLINYGCHPETLADENLLLTSDFVHAVRRTVEQGSKWNNSPGKPGLGGPAIYLNGAVGGMMTTLGVNVQNPDGDMFQSWGYEKADSIGQLLGEMALDAIAEGDEVAGPRLRLAAKRFRANVINTQFKLMFEAGVLEREVFNADMPGKEEIETEMALVELGPIQMLTVPGELLPELAIGGYDGSHIKAPGQPLIDPGNTHPPMVDKAPGGPYIKDRMTSTYRWIIGLGNDELGYIIPEYDFVLAKQNPWLDEAEGDHYEETNSLAPNMATLVDQHTDLLLWWSKG